MSSIKASDVTAFRRRYAESQQVSDNRDTLLNDLLQRVSDMQKTMDRNPFVLVLIDGDCMQFLDHFLLEGIAGGDSAAKGLQKAVFDYLRHEEDFTHDTKIVVRVYANFLGLSRTYVNKGILQRETTFAEFVLGFNKSNPLCDFVDAGNHKEAADSKLKGILKMNLYNVHCKQIIFGAPTDNGYASFLSSFLIDPEIPSRVRVLQAQRFTSEWREILHKFKHTEFKEIFRNEPLKAFRRARMAGNESPITPAKRKNTQDDSNIPRKILRQTLPIIDRKEQNSTGNLKHDTPQPSPIVPLPTSSDEFLEVIVTAEEVNTALKNDSDKLLQETPKSLDFSDVRRKTEERLGLSRDFWQHHGWMSRSKNTIKQAVESWVERTGNPAPKGATWMTGG